eukprot:8219928-Lingulodinium_polyedra.AAC.1
MPVDPLTKVDPRKASAALDETLATGRLRTVSEKGEVARRHLRPDLKSRARAATARRLGELQDQDEMAGA